MTTKTREPITGSDACVMMHTALRKVCDSKITSSVYNMIHLIDVKPERFDTWRLLGQLVADRLAKGEKPVEALRRAHRELENALHERVVAARRGTEEAPSNATTWLYALSCAMHCFSKEDWEGMASYLGDDE